MKHEPPAATDLFSPIRYMVETYLIFPKPPHKSVINMGLGEPTKENGFDIPKEAADAVIEAVQSEKYNGYTLASGSIEARQAVVDKFSKPDHPFTVKDVILHFGGTGALSSALSVLCEDGDNVLLS